MSSSNKKFNQRLKIVLKQEKETIHHKYLLCHIGSRTNFASNTCLDLESQQILVVKNLTGKAKIQLYELRIWLMR